MHELQMAHLISVIRMLHSVANSTEYMHRNISNCFLLLICPIKYVHCSENCAVICDKSGAFHSLKTNIMSSLTNERIQMWLGLKTLRFRVEYLIIFFIGTSSFDSFG